MSYINTTVIPPSFLGVNNTLLQAPPVPLGFSFGCKNCTLSGSANLSSGKFTVNAPPNITNLGDRIKDAFNPRYVKLAVSFSAYIELENSILGGDKFSTFTAPIPDITIPGFHIPGIAEVGPVLRPNVNIGVHTPDSLNFSYGFSLEIPNNSSVVLDIGDPSNSTVTGFQHPSVAALPFQSNIDNLNLTVQVAFNPQLLLVISLFDNDLALEAGGFLDLPKVEATVAKVNHVDEQCNPVNATSHLGDYLFHSLTNVSPSVEIDIGVLADAHASIGNLHADKGITHTLASTIFSLPTACYNFDAKGEAYVTPSPASAASASAAKGPGSKSNANTIRPMSTANSPPSFFALVLFFWCLCMM